MQVLFEATTSPNGFLESNRLLTASPGAAVHSAGKGKWETLGGPLLQHEKVSSIAMKHGRTPAQVLLKWSLQQGICVIPKSVSKAKMEANAATLDPTFTLDEQDMAMLSAMDKGAAGRLCWKNDPLRDLTFA